MAVWPKLLICLPLIAGSVTSFAENKLEASSELNPSSGQFLNVPAVTRDQMVAQAGSVAPPESTRTNRGLPLVWNSDFSTELNDWSLVSPGWGTENRDFEKQPGVAGQVLKVFIPAGSIDPATMRRRSQRYGGTGFKVNVAPKGLETAILSYKVKFPANFQPNRGGKLPGLCGGVCNGGGRIPNGKDGFSARYMWLTGSRGIVYAYIPSSVQYGTALGAGQIFFRRGEWMLLEQEIKLNSVGRSDGHIKVWVDGKLAMDRQGIHFRDTDKLKIDRLYFDVFYGGSNESWAAPADTTIEFAEFAVYGR